MITYHPSVDGGSDYLDFHTPDYDRTFPRSAVARRVKPRGFQT